jgi:hypothetical protein
LKNSALRKVKIRVLAPIPRASEAMAAAVNAGLRRRARKECRRSCQRLSMGTSPSSAASETHYYR